MTAIEKLQQELDQISKNENMNEDQKQEALLTILNHSTRLYMEMLKINLRLKGMPTENPSVITRVNEDVIM